jgi:Ferric reductase like transmembrane component
MMTNNAIIDDAYYYERIGFRNAWISVTQVPVVYLLASKSSIIGCVISSSHERLNWLHRWVSRTLLITVTVHGGFFMREWIRADFVKLEMEMMPMVKYGIGAWAILVWTFFTSLPPLRSMAYEICESPYFLEY